MPVKLTSVVNIKKGQSYDIYIGRPSKWGNPFRLGRDGNRQEVIDRYRSWLKNQPDLLRMIPIELSGKRLGCYCHPLQCHGHILAEIANAH